MKPHILLALAFITTANAADKLSAISEAWQKSITAETSGDYNAAMASVLEFKSAGGETYLASVRAGWLSYLAKEYEKAILFYTTAAKQEPRAMTPYLGMVAVYQAQSKTEDVLRAARAGIALDQFNRPLLLIAGEILYNQKDYRKAETYFERAHKLQPEDPIALSWLGWSQIMQNQVKLAVPMFAKLMQINPDGLFVSDGFMITHPGPPPRR